MKVTVGVPDPSAVDCERIASELPRGRAEVVAVAGGQRIPAADGKAASIVATVGVEAFYPIAEGDWRLTES